MFSDLDILLPLVTIIVQEDIPDKTHLIFYRRAFSETIIFNLLYIYFPWSSVTLNVWSGLLALEYVKICFVGIFAYFDNHQWRNETAAPEIEPVSFTDFIEKIRNHILLVKECRMELTLHVGSQVISNKFHTNNFIPSYIKVKSNLII